MNKKIFTTVILLAVGIIMFNLFSNQTDSMDISSNEFKEKITENRGIIIDVRAKSEYDEGHLKQTDFQYDFLTGEFQDKIEEMDKDETYYLYCRSGNRSGQAARIMKSKGFENVYNVGGFEDLANAGFETE